MEKTNSLSLKSIDKKWFIIDATDQILGRLSSKIANILQGKHKINYTKHLDDGDNVVVINSSKIKLTGKKWEQKKHQYHTGYVGHLREVVYKDLHEKKPDFILKKAIKGMLPKNKLGSKQYGNLYVYSDDKHKQSAQNPELIKI